jgi:hypothetical protein
MEEEEVFKSVFTCVETCLRLAKMSSTEWAFTSTHKSKGRVGQKPNTTSKGEC